MSNLLVAYFSRPGNNYIGGKIINLPVGNTEIAAKMIQKLTEGDIFLIEKINPYPQDYTETTNVANKELRDDARPELSGYVNNMDAYDTIILCYPNWWGTMPMPVFTFLEIYDFTGKKIVPFCTHEGSGMGRSVSDIKKLCPSAKVLEGFAVRGGHVQDAEKDIYAWLQEVEISKD